MSLVADYSLQNYLYRQPQGQQGMVVYSTSGCLAIYLPDDPRRGFGSGNCQLCAEGQLGKAKVQAKGSLQHMPIGQV